MHQGNGDSEIHAHVLGPIDVSEMVREAIKASKMHEAIDESAKDARKAVVGVMRLEYDGLAGRAREHDHFLGDTASAPPLQTCAEAYARHTLAGEAADKLAKAIEEDDHDYAQEARAQAHEHKAQVERWVVKLRNAVKADERMAAAAKEAEAAKA